MYFREFFIFTVIFSDSFDQLEQINYHEKNTSTNSYNSCFNSM